MGFLKLGFVPVLAGLIAMSEVFAAVDSGGGNAVVCFDSPAIPEALNFSKRAGDGWIKDEYINHVTSVEILDLYEAKLSQDVLDPKSRQVVRLKDGEDAARYIERIKNRFEQIFPDIHYELEVAQDQLKSSVAYPSGLNPIDDVNAIGHIDTTNCVLATIIAQVKVAEKRMLIYDPRLFYHPKHSEQSRAVSLLHEYVYLNARIYNEDTTAVRTRLVVGMLISDGITAERFMESLSQLNFSRVYLATYSGPSSEHRFNYGKGSWSPVSLQSSQETVFLYPRIHRVLGEIAQELASVNMTCTGVKRNWLGRKEAICTTEDRRRFLDQKREMYQKWKKAVLEFPNFSANDLARLDAAIQAEWIETLHRIPQGDRRYGDALPADRHGHWIFPASWLGVTLAFDFKIPTGE